MKTLLATLILLTASVYAVTIEITIAARNNAGTITNQAQVITLNPRQTARVLEMTSTNVKSWLTAELREGWDSYRGDRNAKEIRAITERHNAEAERLDD